MYLIYVCIVYICNLYMYVFYRELLEQQRREEKLRLQSTTTISASTVTTATTTATTTTTSTATTTTPITAIVDSTPSGSPRRGSVAQMRRTFRRYSLMNLTKVLLDGTLLPVGEASAVGTGRVGGEIEEEEMTEEAVVVGVGETCESRESTRRGLYTTTEGGQLEEGEGEGSGKYYIIIPYSCHADGCFSYCMYTYIFV